MSTVAGFDMGDFGRDLEWILLMGVAADAELALAVAPPAVEGPLVVRAQVCSEPAAICSICVSVATGEGLVLSVVDESPS